MVRHPSNVVVFPILSMNYNSEHPRGEKLSIESLEYFVLAAKEKGI